MGTTSCVVVVTMASVNGESIRFDVRLGEVSIRPASVTHRTHSIHCFLFYQAPGTNGRGGGGGGGGAASSLADTVTIADDRTAFIHSRRW